MLECLLYDPYFRRYLPSPPYPIRINRHPLRIRSIILIPPPPSLLFLPLLRQIGRRQHSLSPSASLFPLCRPSPTYLPFPPSSRIQSYSNPFSPPLPTRRAHSNTLIPLFSPRSLVVESQELPRQTLRLRIRMGMIIDNRTNSRINNRIKVIRTTRLVTLLTGIHHTEEINRITINSQTDEDQRVQ